MGFCYACAPLFLRLGDGTVWVLVNPQGRSSLSVCRKLFNGQSDVRLYRYEEDAQRGEIKVCVACDGKRAVLEYRLATPAEAVEMNRLCVVEIRPWRYVCDGCVVC
jgi:hypothetical protein